MPTRQRLSRRQFLELASGATVGVAAVGKASAKVPAKDEADVIVVGAGALGCHAAWHLREKGLSVLVVEAAAAPASQTTQAAAGFVALWSAIHVKEWGRTEWHMEHYGIELYTRQARTCRTDIGFSSGGVSYIYLTRKAWQDAQPRIEIARGLGTRLEVLNSQRAARLLPGINFKATVGIVYDPDAVRVRAGEAMACLVDQLARRRVRFKYNTVVTGFLSDGRRVYGVTTNVGALRSSTVVVTAGSGTRPLVEASCAPCPVDARVATRWTTKPLPGISESMPTLIFSDFHGAYVGEERGRLLIGGSLPAPDMRESLRELEHVMPALKDADIADIVGGTPTFTKDFRFVLDAVPGCRGLYVVAGCQQFGITHGPALGRMLAELVVNGATRWDRTPYSLERFRPAPAQPG